MLAHAPTSPLWLVGAVSCVQGAYPSTQQCEAMRRIVELHHEYIGTCTHCVDARGEHQREAWPCSTLRHLVAIWSDHPDYDPAWRA